VNVGSRGDFDEMFGQVKLHNTALIIEVKPYVIHSVIISILFEHKHIVRFEIKLNQEEPSELLTNFHDPFLRKERRG